MKRDILYVDDEVDNLIVFESTFEDEFNIRTATSGAEALRMLEETPAPVVVIDQRMPGMTGVELCEILRYRFPHTKRIILTGYTDADAMLDAINQGQVFYFLTKPWERHLLMSVLIRAVEAHDLEIANMALTDQLVILQRCAALGQVTARVAHEMANQLLILPLVELIEKRYAHYPDLVLMAKFANQGHERMAALIEELKAFVRFEQEDLPQRPVALAEAIHELVSFLRFDNSIPQLCMSVSVLSEPVVLANKIKIQQVVSNLLKNAAYAIRGRDDGQIKLMLDCDETNAVIEVADNGCGIAPETLERIWEPFFTTKGDEGNGLGLDICRRLIEGYGGQIVCESEPDEGSTFSIRLPLVVGAALQRPTSAEPIGSA